MNGPRVVRESPMNPSGHRLVEPHPGCWRFSALAQPALTRAITNLLRLLDRAEAYGREGPMPEAALLEQRLAPDMYPLRRQFQVGGDFAHNAAARLTGTPTRAIQDRPGTAADLRTELETRKRFIESLDPDAFDLRADQPVAFSVRGEPRWFADGPTYLLASVLPHIHFHTAIAYGILRHVGCDLTKDDYIGPRDPAPGGAAAPRPRNSS